MYCPYCRNPDSRVIDSRTGDDGTAIRRRRACPACGRRFTTQETVILTVAKRSGVTEPFNRDKIVRGVRRACQGRPVSEDQLALLWKMADEPILIAPVVQQHVEQPQAELAQHTPSRLATPEEIRAADQLFAKKEHEAQTVSGLLGLYTGALLLRDLAAEHLSQLSSRTRESTSRAWRWMRLATFSIARLGA